MLAGLWGARNSNKRDSLYELGKAIFNAKPRNYWDFDQALLRRIVWPEAAKDSMQHDSYTCNFEKFAPNSFPFPTRRGEDHLYAGWGPVKGKNIIYFILFIFLCNNIYFCRQQYGNKALPKIVPLAARLDFLLMHRHRKGLAGKFKIEKKAPQCTSNHSVSIWLKKMELKEQTLQSRYLDFMWNFVLKTHISLTRHMKWNDEYIEFIQLKICQKLLYN